MKNGIYFIVIAFWVGKSFKIWIYANWRTCDMDTELCKITKWKIVTPEL